MVNLSETGVIPESAMVELHDLAQAAAGFASKGKAESTLKVYRRDWSAFAAWCDARGLQSLPAAPEAVALYITHLAQQDRKPATIERKLVGISQAHKHGRLPSPTTAVVVRETLKGIRRSLGVAQEQKAPLAVSELRRVLDVLPGRLLGVRDRALLLVGFAGAFRRSELVRFDVGDCAFVDDGAILTLRYSKTDQEGEGRLVGLPFGSTPDVCPVRSLRRWLDASGIEVGSIFRPIDRWAHVGVNRLSDAAVAKIVKRYVAVAGMDASRFAGHSLRAGFATAAAKAGKSERAIMAQTGHRSVAMVRKYIRDGSLFNENAASGLL